MSKFMGEPVGSPAFGPMARELRMGSQGLFYEAE